MSIGRDKRLPPRAEVQTHTHGNKINIWAPLWAAGRGEREHTQTVRSELGSLCVEAPTPRAQSTPGVIAGAAIGFPRGERADQGKTYTHTHANFSFCPFYHSGKALVMVNHRKRALSSSPFPLLLFYYYDFFLHCRFSMPLKKKKKRKHPPQPKTQTNKQKPSEPPALPQPGRGAGRAAGCDEEEEEEGGGLEVAGAPSIPGHIARTLWG